MQGNMKATSIQAHMQLKQAKERSPIVIYGASTGSHPIQPFEWEPSCPPFHDWLFKEMAGKGVFSLSPVQGSTHAW
ncbi:hypothetical protein FRX31_009502 [Thalictrum thalictroides]|uniref:Uncharacterized protein n=1 Tax=Thalictrum thalictroides TaxID=46969 RepID=A0A7J6WU04_THATH|nr:hypothetical protein FRX31_009502 [Thalictrum thalictroides]